VLHELSPQVPDPTPAAHAADDPDRFPSAVGSDLMQSFALAVIGSGSGHVVIPDADDGRTIAVIEMGAFGGTCINHGCIPSKMFGYTADLAMQVRRAPAFGLGTELESVDWPAIRDRIMTRVDETSEAGRKKQVDSPQVTVFDGRARFTGPHQLEIDGSTPIQADQIVIATGSRPFVPSVVAESGVPFHTSDTIMRLESLPASMVILGGGSVAMEFAHIFSSFGVEIHVVDMASRLMETLDDELSNRFTSEVAERWDAHLDATVDRVESDGAGVSLVLDDGTRVTGDLLLVATGRRPTTEDLGLDAADVSVREDGHLVVDEFGRAGPGIWGLGDVSSPFELKHVANAEARTIAHNLANPQDLRPLPHDWVPSALFSDPQVASVGARSQDLEGREYVQATQHFGDTAYGWALQDQRGICRLYADPTTGRLLGAHILGHQAALLITPLIQAVAHGQRVADLARGQYWIHPALSEVVENALLKLPLDRRVRSGQAH
jgi:mycothione reductase